MLSYHTLFLEQSDIVSFEGLFNNIIIIIGIFLFILHIKTNNECFYLY